MDLSRETEFPADLSPLAWVQEELRRTLESVHKALRRVLRDADTRTSTLGGDGQPSPALQGAAQQMHQAAGVLSVVSLPAAAQLLRAAEATLFRLAENPAAVTVAEVEAVERADFAVLAFIAKTLAGGQPSSLALFPAYQTLQELNGAGRIHPADLWTQEFRWRDLPVDPAVRALTPEQMRAPFEALLLKQMRAPAPGQGKLLSDLCAGLALTQNHPHARTLWMLAAGQFEAQSRGLLPVDTLVKRLGSRLLAQLRAGSDAAPSERLAKDLLFFAAAARHPQPGTAPRLEAVQVAYGLIEAPVVDYRDDALGRIDPTWVQNAKRRVATAKESWASAAEGETHRLGGLDEQFAGVAESLQKLFPSGEVLGETLRRAIVATLRSGRAPEPTLAMEIATCMLYLEAALEDEAFDQPEQAERVRSLARRIESVGHGEAPEPLEAWMEELYRRVADRQTLGSVVHELRASLSEVERQCDEYFRDPSKRDLLIPVPGQLQAMRGVFSVLGVTQAAQAAVRMRDQIDELANTEVDPSLPGPRAQFDRLANNLGALGFLIDMLSVQPQLAKRMFRFDESTGMLESLVGRESELHERAESPAEAEVTAPQLLDQLQATAQAVAQGDRSAEDLARDLERISNEARAADDLGLAQAAQQAQQQLLAAGDDTVGSHAAESLQQFIEAAAPVAPQMPEPSAPIPQAEEAIDEEMLGIFLEEAAEVVATAREALGVLARASTDQEQLTTVRRAFHTLKGSSRMVGLGEFGEAGWACEQLYNHRLSEHPQADADLLRFSQEALDAFEAWAAAIGEGRPHGYHSAPFRAAADALRLENRYQPLTIGAAPAAPVATPAAAAAAVAGAAAIAPVAASPAAPELPQMLDVVETADLPVVGETVELTDAFTLPELTDTPAALDAVPVSPMVQSLSDLDLPSLDLPSTAAAPAPLPAAEPLPTPSASDLPLDFPAQLPELTQALPQLDNEVDLPAVHAAPITLDDPLELPLMAEVVEPSELIEPAPALGDVSVETLEMPEGWPSDAAVVEVEATEPMPLDEPLPTAEADEPPLDLMDLSGLQPDITPAAPAPEVELSLDLGRELVEAPAEAPIDLSFDLHADAPADATLDAADRAVAESTDAAAAAAAAQAAPLDLGAILPPADALDLPGPSEPAAADEGVLDLSAPASTADALDLSFDEPTATLDIPDLSDADLAAVAATAAPGLSLVGGTAVARDAGTDEPADEAEESDEGVKVIGPLRISIALFNIFLNEADERSRRLQVELTEWSLLPQSPLPADAEPLAHGLAGSAATVGFDDLSALARELEHALGRAQGHEVADPTLFQRAADEIRRLLHQFAAGFLKEADAALVAELHAFEPGAPLRDGHADSDEGLLAMTLEDLSTAAQAVEVSPPAIAAAPVAPTLPTEPSPNAVLLPSASDDGFDFSLPDQIEPELMPIFEEEAEDLLHQLHAALREWAAQPGDIGRAAACMRVLHTFKGGARLAGAMRLGEQAHELETQIERIAQDGDPQYDQLLSLQDEGDALEHAFQTLQRTWRNPAPVVPAPMPAPAVSAPVVAEPQAVADVAPAADVADVTGAAEPQPTTDDAAVAEAAMAEAEAAEAAVAGTDHAEAAADAAQPVAADDTTSATIADASAPAAETAETTDVPAPAEAPVLADLPEVIEPVQSPAEGSDAVPAPEGDAQAEAQAAAAAQPAELAEPFVALDGTDTASTLSTAESAETAADATDASATPDTAAAELTESVPAADVIESAEVTETAEAAEAADVPVADSDVPAEPVEAAATAPAATEAPTADEPAAAPQAAAAVAAPAAPIEIDWARFSQAADLGQPLESAPVAPAAQVRVRGALLERMAALSGEVSIRRARLESEMGQMRNALSDLDDNLERLRTQLRELELQAEARIAARQEAAQASGKDFDPLEFDRYTRFQELTRMLAESVNDVATVQRGLQRNVAAGEDELAAQSRLTRELQDDLLRTRMVEFDTSMGERLHRVVRQAARESGKQAQLEIRGGGVELDRAVLERLTGAFEHLLRNSVVHGIESPQQRQSAGKPAAGRIVLNLHQEGNEVQVRFADDGAGLNLERIKARGLSQGLIAPGQELSDAELMELVYEPGFSTAESLTEMAGRGVGMDVVRSEVNTLGGYVLTASTPGQGASFELRVPLTTALTQVVVLRYGDRKVAVPASLMLSVQRLTGEAVEKAYAEGFLTVGGERMPFHWLGGLMHESERGSVQGKTVPVVLVHSAQQRLALHVDEVLGNQEVVVKNLGPQLMQVPGLAGISLLASGDVALIYNPVALANRYGHAAHQRLVDSTAAAQQVVVEAVKPPQAPLIMVVDDSLTVRRVTQRMLDREGYRVLLAKDGLDAMERLAGEELPALVLSDIEMPRMDGFDLVRNLRADPRLAALPVIMITSRIAQKHRDYAQQLGVDDYLGKPYDEEHLLGLIARYTSQNASGQPVAS